MPDAISDARLRLSFTPSDHDPADIQVLEFTDEALTAGLKHEVGTKAGSAFLPCILQPAYRANANARAMTALVLDLDHLEEGALDLIVERLRVKGVKHWYFTTYSYPNARLFIPFAKELPLSSPDDWSQVAWPKLVAHLGLDDVAKADPACRDAARLYYEPRRPASESPARSGFSPGAALDWEAILGEAPKSVHPKRISPPGAPPRPRVEDPSLPVDIEAVRKKLLKKLPGSFANKLAKGDALSPPPDRRRAGEPARAMAWFYAMGSLSMAAEPWMATAALLELARPSWHAEADESPDDFTPWEKVEALLIQQRASAEAKKAEYEAKRAAAKEEWQRILGQKLSAPKEPEEEGAPAPTSVTVNGLQGEELVAALEWSEAKEGKERVLLKSLANLSTILRDSFFWKGNLRQNLLTGMVECWGGPCFEPGIPPFELRNVHVLYIRQWMVNVFGVEFFKEAVNEVIDMAAQDNAYDPVVDYLRSLTWDGKARLNGILETYCKAEVTKDNAPYVRAVGSKWMISAVARALEPGCQADSMLVLQGDQGIRKSSAVRVLGGKWAADFVFDVSSNEAMAACGVNWIMEMGELASLSRSDRDKVKEFLSRCTDKYRAPYDKRQENHPRRCVIIGTSNEDEIFSDETGNRRFWPVTCTGQIDTDGLARDRDQLWAEAVHRYEAGEKWHLDQESACLAAKEATSRMKHDAIMDVIVEWYERQQPAARRSEVRVLDLAKSALGMDRQPDAREQARIVAAMKRLGFKKLPEKRVDGVVRKVWATPENLLRLPYRTHDSAGHHTAAGLAPEASA